MNKIFSKAGLTVFVALMMVLLGVSYAGYTSILETNISMDSGNMDFQFSGDNDDFSIGIQNGENGNIRAINADIAYDGKDLTITGMDPINMELLKDGDLRIIIQYEIAAADTASIKKAASIDSEKIADKAGIINIQRTTKAPQWKIESSSGSWELGDKDIGDVPRIIYNLLPESLGDFQVSQTLTVDKDRDGMQGVIILSQKEVPDLLSTESISLSSLGLSHEIAVEMMDKAEDLTLTMQGCYDFTVPLALDQFNRKETY